MREIGCHAMHPCWICDVFPSLNHPWVALYRWIESIREKEMSEIMIWKNWKGSESKEARWTFWQREIVVIRYRNGISRFRRQNSEQGIEMIFLFRLIVKMRCFCEISFSFLQTKLTDCLSWLRKASPFKTKTRLTLCSLKSDGLRIETFDLFRRSGKFFLSKTIQSELHQAQLKPR